MSIEVQNLSFSYGDRPVLHDISFRVEKGEFLSILGPNGVGKSTLFRCVLGLLSGYPGQVLVDGADSRSFTVREAARHIAYIPQSSHPIFNYSVFDIALMGRTSGLSTFRSPKKKDAELCRWALEKVGIPHLSDRCFHRLSGGEQQLVLIARALVQKAPILMLDEPTASLDFGNQLRVLEQIDDLGFRQLGEVCKAAVCGEDTHCAQQQNKQGGQNRETGTKAFQKNSSFSENGNCCFVFHYTAKKTGKQGIEVSTCEKQKYFIKRQNGC